jgi:hypothetical protein
MPTIVAARSPLLQLAHFWFFGGKKQFGIGPLDPHLTATPE